MARIRLLGIPVLAAVSVVLVGVRPVTGQTKTARGTVVSVTDASLVVKAGATDMTFAVDNKTVVAAPGAGRKTRDAKTAGAAGIKLTSVVKPGGAVRVTYKEDNGKLLATAVQTVSTPGPAGGSPAAPAGTKLARGTVKSVSPSSLTITTDGKDSTFAITESTVIAGQGAGTATKAAGGRIAITSLVGTGDTVGVTYREAGSAMQATQVRVVIKAR
jgi:hypothetical protein